MQKNVEFTAEQRGALREVVDAVRQLIGYCMNIDADAGTLSALAAQTRQLAAAMAPHTGRKGLEHFTFDFGDDLNSPLPQSPITGRYNPVAPPVELRLEGQTLIGEVTLGKVYEGGTGMAHGSWIAAIYDQLLAFAGLFNGTAGPTANLSIDFLKPTPIDQPLRFEAKVDSADERKVFISGTCYCDGVLVTKCEGLFIRIHRKW